MTLVSARHGLRPGVTSVGVARRHNMEIREPDLSED